MPASWFRTPLFDTLLRAADAGLYEPRWSMQILDEVERTLVNKMGGAEKAKGRIIAMQRAFPHAQVEGHEDLVDTMRNDPKDRHVLAAGVRTGAGAIVTANVKDFPATALAPYAIEALHPDDFLLDLLDLDTAAVTRVLAEQAQRYANPPVPLPELRRHLSLTVPRFAAEAERHVDHGPMPLPLTRATPIWQARSATPPRGPRGSHRHV